MEKIIVLFLIVFLLCGCKNQKSTVCSYFYKDATVDIDIKSTNDVIDYFYVRLAYDLPYLKQEFFDDLASQIDESYHFENNQLVKEYEIELDKEYSLSKTLQDLRSKRFYCE